MLIELDNLGADTVLADVYDFDHAFKEFVPEKLTFEMKRLSDIKRPGAHDQKPAVTHVLYDTGKILHARVQFASFRDFGPQLSS